MSSLSTELLSNLISEFRIEVKVYIIGYYQISRIRFLNLKSANLVGLSSALEFLWDNFVAQTKEYEVKRDPVKWGQE